MNNLEAIAGSAPKIAELERGYQSFDQFSYLPNENNGQNKKSSVNWPMINHYSSRIFIDSWVPLAGLAVLAVPAAIGTLAVKLQEPQESPFYKKKIHTSDGTEQFQLKTRTMKKGADKRTKELIEKGILQPAGVKAKNDPRVTIVGKILRKLSLDEYWQLGQLAKHAFTEGFFYNEGKHFHYTVAPRPQTKESIEVSPKEYRDALSKGRTGITGHYQVGEGTEGECAQRFHEYFENKWILPDALRVVIKTPLKAFGKNA